MTTPAKQKVDTRVTVETPEGVDFQFSIAGPGKRAAAYILDTVLMTLVVAAITWIVAIFIAVTAMFTGMGIMVMLLLWFAAQWLYRSTFEGLWNGQTPAKRMMNLRVVRTNGTPIGWFEAFGRNCLLVADGFPPVTIVGLNTAGLISMSITPHMQRLGDLFFDTMVIDESRDIIRHNTAILRNIERIPRSQCSGRYHVPERTLAVIERLFDGDRIISEARREEIARILSLTLQKRLGYEDDGPDSQNPHPYFQKAPQKHAIFLKRILKTFADDPDGNASADQEEKESRNSLNAALNKAKRRQTGSFGQKRDTEPNPFLMSSGSQNSFSSGTAEDPS